MNGRHGMTSKRTMQSLALTLSIFRPMNWRKEMKSFSHFAGLNPAIGREEISAFRSDLFTAGDGATDLDFERAPAPCGLTKERRTSPEHL
jgi:hypothetical protein